MIWWQLRHSLEGGIAWMFHSANCLEGRWGQSSACGKTPLQTTSSTCSRKGSLGLLGPDQGRGALGSCREIVLITYEERQPGDTASIGPSKRVQQSQVALTDIYTGTRNASFAKEGRRHCQIISGEWVSNLLRYGLIVAFRAEQLLLAHGSLAGKFKCLAIIWDNRKACQGIQVVNWQICGQRLDRKEVCCGSVC